MSSSAATRRFTQVDVFGAAPLLGNPLAVVIDAEGLDEQQMAAFASWTNLSETTFLLPPTQQGADYRVRIFTPQGELPFAGHPTLGSAAAWLRAGGEPQRPAAGEPVRLVQECEVGLVEVRAERSADGALGALSFAAPPRRRTGPLEPAHLDAALAALGAGREQARDHAWADNGPGWAVIELGSAQEVRDLDVDVSRIPGRKIASLGLIGPEDGGADGAAYEVRAFVAPDPETGTAGYEDPVTGSLNAGVAQWMLERGRFAGRWSARQGSQLGRDGRVALSVDEVGEVWVGGAVHELISGTVEL